MTHFQERSRREAAWGHVLVPRMRFANSPKPGVDQRTRLDNGDVEALAGIAITKPEMRHQSSACDSRDL
jgi:hypothetical protein